jgi:hypothetical protein
LTPESCQPVAVFSARVAIASGLQSRSASSKVTVARASPVAMGASQRFFCTSVPASTMAVAVSMVGQYGPG